MDSSIKSNPPAGIDPDDLMAEAAEQAAVDPLDDILRQIVGGYFVLTDGQGSVSKWSEPAELLFGRPAAEVLGQSFFATLVKAPIPAAAETWRRFLEAGEAPSAPGRVEVSGVQAEGDDFPMEAVFVPVKLDEGFDFSLFLEDLGFELPMNLMLQRMRAQHPVVVRAMRQALEPVPQPWEGWRTAGTLVVFRPLEATPWVEAELARREAARAEADAEVEERLTNLDPGIQGTSVADLDDAAAVVGRLLSAMERIDELERIALGLPTQLEEARKSAERRAEAAEREAAALRAEDHRDLLARLERLERARLDAEQAAHDRFRALDVAEAARNEHEQAAHAARTELAETIERLERDRAREAETARAELAAALQRVDHVQREADALREQLTAVTVERAEAGDDRRRLDDLARDAEATRARIDGLRDELAPLEALHGEVAALRHGATDLDALRAELQSGAGELEAFRAELAALHSASSDLTALRGQVESLRGGLPDLEPLRSRLDALEGLRERIDAAAGSADLDALRAELGTLREGAAELAALRGEIAGGTAQLDALRHELDAVRAEAAGVAALRGEHEELRARQDEVRGWLDDARRERDEFRAAGERTSAQVEELRRSLEEREHAIPAAHAVERDVVDAMGGEVDALRSAEQALRMRLAELAATGEAASRRIDELGEADREVAGRLEQLTAASEATARRVEEVRDDVAGEAAHAARTADAAAERLHEVAAAIGHRIDEVDRGAGAVLSDVRTLRERLDELSAGAVDRAEAEELHAAVARLGGEVEAARSQVEHAGHEALGAREQAAAAGEAATAAREDAGRAREESAAVRRELEAIGERVERLGKGMVEAEQAASAALEAQGNELRAELASVRRVAEEAREGFEALRGEIDGLREVREDAASARAAAEAGERRVEAMQAELTYALQQLEDVKAGLTSAGQTAIIARREAEQAKRAAAQSQAESGSGVNEVFQQLLAAARGGNSAAAGRLGRPLTPAQDLRRKAEPAPRAPRHGFDDASQPRAILSLDGRFRELNPAFARLVGYSEHAFAKAVWPSPHDRAGYQQQHEQLRQLASGEIDSVSVQSTYMHGQGLMVPVVGILRVVPGEDGLPLHLLLEAEDRHTS